MKRSIDDEIIRKVLENLGSEGRANEKLAYLTGRYVELNRIYCELLWRLTSELTSGKISGAQVVIGLINWDIVLGAIGLVLTIGLFGLGFLYPPVSIWLNTTAIISLAISIGGFVNYALRVKGKLKLPT